jgi:hypothetical protein
MKILITVPAHNEEEELKEKMIKLYNYLTSLKINFTLEIVDSASTDNTYAISKELSSKYTNIKCISLKKKGKWRAIKKSWNNTSKRYDILSFMDADLATDITYFPKLINAIEKEGYDISIGSRYSKKSKTKRTLFRNIIGKSFIIIQKTLFRTSYDDSQCGFKAIKYEKYASLKKYITNNEFQGDIELLIISEKIFGYKIKSIPVAWTEQRKTTINFIKTIFNFLKELGILFWNTKIRNRNIK